MYGYVANVTEPAAFARHIGPPLPWSTLVEGGKERYRPPGKLTLELVLANQNKKTFMFMDYPAYQVGQ